MTGPQTLGRPIASQFNGTIEGAAPIRGYYVDGRTDLLAHILPIGMGNGGTVGVANVLVFWRIIPVENVVITGAQVLCDAGAAGGELRVGIYTAGPTGLPSALVVDSGAITATSSGNKTATLTPTRLFGNVSYWGCYVANSASITVRKQTSNLRNTQVDHLNIPLSSGSPQTAQAGLEATFTYAALPASAPATSYSSSSARDAIAVAWTTRVP